MTTVVRRPRVVVLELAFLALGVLVLQIPHWYGKVLFWLTVPVSKAVVSREMRRADERLLQQGRLTVSTRRFVPEGAYEMPDAAVRLRTLRRQQVALAIAGLALSPLAVMLARSAFEQGDLRGELAAAVPVALPLGLAIHSEVRRRAVRDSAEGRRVHMTCRVLGFGEENPSEVVLAPGRETLAEGHRPLVAALPHRHARHLALGDEVHVFGDFRPGRCLVVTTPEGSVWSERLRDANITATAADNGVPRS